MFLLAVFTRSQDTCSIYTNDGCILCVSHYADRQCGWLASSTPPQCVFRPNSTDPNIIFGPGSQCSGPRPSPGPTLTPIVTPTPYSFSPDECGNYGACTNCTLHYSDRQCGWCGSTNQCVQYNGSATRCNLSEYYYNNNAVCGGEVPPPNPTPWPRYAADPDFCYAMTDQWCKKCVSSNKSQSCGWCHSTKECIMGDLRGPLFGSCDNWMPLEDDQCLGKLSSGAIVGVRVGLSLAIALLVVLAVLGCYRVISRPAHDGDYESLDRHK
jgi:hypothetical protein